MSALVALTQWLNDQHLVFDYSKQSVRTQEGKLVSLKELMARLRLDLRCEIETPDGGSKRYRPKPQDIDDAFHLWIAASERMFLKQAKDRLLMRRSGPEGEGYLADFLEAFDAQPRDSERFFLDYQIMRHFIWQVKRKLAGLESEYHIMPVLVGRSGGGKTETIRRFLRPVKDLTMAPPGLTILTDERSVHAAVSRNYVLFFDEMGRADKADVGVLKNIMTSLEVPARIMKSNVVDVVPNVASFIGASNSDVSGMIYDPTSGRRFWQINCKDDIDQDEVNFLADRCMEDIWDSVDHTADSPARSHRAKIEPVQHAEVRAKDNVEEFIEACVTKVGGGCEGGREDGEDECSSADAYTIYSGWCRMQGIKQWSQVTFGRALSKHLPSRKSKGRMVYCGVIIKNSLTTV